MDFEIASREESRHGSPADAGIPDVQVIVAAAHDELRRLIQQRTEITKRIGKIKQTIGGLCTLFGDDEVNDHTRELVNDKVIVRRSGITQACRKVLMEAGCPLTARNVSEQIQQGTTLNPSGSKNLVATVTTVLNRLGRYGEARTVPRHTGPRAWVWVSGVEEKTFRPLNSPLASQVLASK